MNLLVNDEPTNNRKLLIGPTFSGKTYLLLKILSKLPDRDIHKITKSPPEPYSIYQIKIKEFSEEIQPLNEYENAIIVFDEILGSSNRKYMDQFFIKGRHTILDICYLSQSYFDLPKCSISENTNKRIVFTQTLKVTQNLYRLVGGYGISFDDFKQICRKLWEEEYNYLCIDISKERDQGKFCICKESENTNNEYIPETKSF